MKTTTFIPILGSLELTIPQTVEYFKGASVNKYTQWKAMLEEGKKRNQTQIDTLIKTKEGLSMGYYQVFNRLRPFMDGEDFVVVSEGANTMVRLLSGCHYFLIPLLT